MFFDFYQEIISLLILKDTGIQSRKIILKFCIRNDQLPSDNGHLTSKHVSMFEIQHKKTQGKTLNMQTFSKKLTHDLFSLNLSYFEFLHSKKEEKYLCWNLWII